MHSDIDKSDVEHGQSSSEDRREMRKALGAAGQPKSGPLLTLKKTARWYKQSIDMFPDFYQVVMAAFEVFELQSEAAQLADDEDTFTDHEISVVKAFHCLTPYFRMAVEECGDDVSKVNKLIALLRAASDGSRQTDTTNFKVGAMLYFLPDGKSQIRDDRTPLNPHDDKQSSRGFLHIDTAFYLCPNRLTLEFQEGPEDFMAEVVDGGTPITDADFPNFCYPAAMRCSFREGRISDGLLQSEFLVDMWRHAFLGEESVRKVRSIEDWDNEPDRGKGKKRAHKGKKKGKGLGVNCRARKHRMRHVTPESIGYIMVQARFALSSLDTWASRDGSFNASRWYYDVVKLLKNKDDQWAVKVLEWWDDQVPELRLWAELDAPSTAFSRFDDPDEVPSYNLAATLAAERASNGFTSMQELQKQASANEDHWTRFKNSRGPPRRLPSPECEPQSRIPTPEPSPQVIRTHKNTQPLRSGPRQPAASTLKSRDVRTTSARCNEGNDSDDSMYYIDPRLRPESRTTGRERAESLTRSDLEQRQAEEDRSRRAEEARAQVAEQERVRRVEEAQHAEAERVRVEAERQKAAAEEQRRAREAAQRLQDKETEARQERIWQDEQKRREEREAADAAAAEKLRKFSQDARLVNVQTGRQAYRSAKLQARQAYTTVMDNLKLRLYSAESDVRQYDYSADEALKADNEVALNLAEDKLTAARKLVSSLHACIADEDARFKREAQDLLDAHRALNGAASEKENQRPDSREETQSSTTPADLPAESGAGAGTSAQLQIVIDPFGGDLDDLSDPDDDNVHPPSGAFAEKRKSPVLRSSEDDNGHMDTEEPLAKKKKSASRKTTAAKAPAKGIRSSLRNK